MAWKLTINGVDKTSFVSYNPEPTITKKQNERSSASFTLEPGFVPNKYDPVIIYDVDGVTQVFGGIITKRVTAGIEPGAKAHKTQITCVDWMNYADWCFWTKTYTTAQTLKQILTDVIGDKLSAYGITLDAAQDTGDTIPPFTVTDVKVSDFLRSLMNACSPTRVVSMSPGKALRVLVPGTTSAPVAITDAAPNCLSFEWQDSTFTPANKVTLTVGPNGAPAFVDSASATAPGGVNTFVFDVGGNANNTNVPYTLDGGGGTIHVGGVIKNSAVGDFTWTLDPVAATATLVLASTPGAGVVIDFLRNIQPPYVVISASGATPVIEFPASDPVQLSVAAAKLEANGLLAKLNQSSVRDATIVTQVNGFLPSQQLTATLTSREIGASTTFQITQVVAAFTEQSDITHVRLWKYTLTATETLAYQGSYLDQFRSMIGGGSGGVTNVSGGGGTVIALAAPVYMGGDYFRSVTNPSAAKALIPDAVPYVATASFTGTLRANVRAHDGGVGAQVIISDGTTDTASSVVTSTTFSDITVGVSIVAGKTYKVYVKTNAAGDAYVGYAQLVST